jgi:hypothetical protein
LATVLRSLPFRGNVIGSIATKSDFAPMAYRQVDPVRVEELQLLEEHYVRQTSLGYTQEAFDEPHLAMALESRVNMTLVETQPVDGCPRVSQVHSGPRSGGVDHVTLAKRWKISLKKAKDTIRHTTQGGFARCCTPPGPDGSGRMISTCGTGGCLVICTVTLCV